MQAYFERIGDLDHVKAAHARMDQKPVVPSTKLNHRLLADKLKAGVVFWYAVDLYIL